MTKIKSNREEKERLGAALQLLAHIVLGANPLQVQVHFSRPISLSKSSTTDLDQIHRQVISQMRELFSQNSIELL